jgi:hypothetical protein
MDQRGTYDRAAPVCLPGLTAPRAGLIPIEVIGPMAPCACASLFVTMSGSVTLPQMRHFHPSYSQAQPPSKCMATLIPPHRSQVIRISIDRSEHVCVTAGLFAYDAGAVLLQLRTSCRLFNALFQGRLLMILIIRILSQLLPITYEARHLHPMRSTSKRLGQQDWVLPGESLRYWITRLRGRVGL